MQTIVPVSFFDGTWLYQRSFVKMSEEEVKIEDDTIHLVEFQKEDDRLVAVSSVNLNRIKHISMPVVSYGVIDHNMDVVETVTPKDMGYVMIHHSSRMTDNSLHFVLEEILEGEAPIAVNHFFKRAENSP